MIRKAFVMSVHAGKEEAYEQRHSPIWPELEAVLREHGYKATRSFSIPKPGSYSLMRRSMIKSAGKR